MSLNFHENGDFNNFTKIIFACGQHKRCGMAILLQNLISGLSKIRKNRENKVIRKFASIRYSISPQKTHSHIIHYIKLYSSILTLYFSSLGAPLDNNSD